MEWHELLVAALAAIATTPLAFFLPNCPCCEEGCGVADGKPRTDPANEGTWVPSGTWRGVGGVTWSFTANPGDDSGETWFFFGSNASSKVGGGATVAETRDWGNICNWYSSKTTSPSTIPSSAAAFDKRATRFPPENAVVHVYGSISTVTAGPQNVGYIYFWSTTFDVAAPFMSGSEVSTSANAHDSDHGAVFNTSSINQGVVNGGALFKTTDLDAFALYNSGTVNDGATFIFSNRNLGTVNGGAVFKDSSVNAAVINGGATFDDNAFNNLSGTINGGATFNDESDNDGTINDGATFNDQSKSDGLINGGAIFNDTSRGLGLVNGGAVFNSDSRWQTGTVNGGAVFNDNASTQRTRGNFFSVPCSRKFVVHPTDSPTCNGTAPDGCANAADTSGCG